MSDPIIWTPGITLAAIEERIIKRALIHYRGNITTTATSLGISPRTIDHKLEKYDKEEADRAVLENDRQFKRQEFLARARGIYKGPDNSPTAPSMEPIQDTIEPVQTTRLKKSR